MNDAKVELDFLGLLASSTAAGSDLQPTSDHQYNLRGVHGSMSGISPALQRSSIASATAKLPLLSLASSRPATENTPGASPLTIFYNGTVAVFDLPADKAEEVIKMAAEVNVPPLSPAGYQSGPQDVNNLRKLKDWVPGARSHSLKRFLEKRKERLTAADPYFTSTTDDGTSTSKTSPN